VSVRDGGGVLKAAYGYDGLNRRISEQVAASAAGDAASAAIRDLFYSAQWQVLEERLRSGGAVGTTAEARYVWSPVYVDAMVLRERGSERVYALQDGNWNTTALIAAAGVPGKASGEVIQRMVYNPYGEVFLLNPDWTEQLGTPLVAWQHLFQGLKFTEATGLGYVRYRDYSPSLGRFIELDPIGFSAGDTNWYRFVGNRPTTLRDPSGLIACEEGCKMVKDPGPKPEDKFGPYVDYAHLTNGTIWRERDEVHYNWKDVPSALPIQEACGKPLKGEFGYSITNSDSWNISFLANVPGLGEFLEVSGGHEISSATGSTSTIYIDQPAKHGFYYIAHLAGLQIRYERTGVGFQYRDGPLGVREMYIRVGTYICECPCPCPKPPASTSGSGSSP
jgi:RHS repeat-associated protein